MEVVPCHFHVMFSLLLLCVHPSTTLSPYNSLHRPPQQQSARLGHPQYTSVPENSSWSVPLSEVHHTHGRSLDIRQYCLLIPMRAGIMRGILDPLLLIRACWIEQFSLLNWRNITIAIQVKHCKDLSNVFYQLGCKLEKRLIAINYFNSINRIHRVNRVN